MSTPFLGERQLQPAHVEKVSIGFEDFARLANNPVAAGSYHELPAGLEVSYRSIRRESGRTAALYLRELLRQIVTHFRVEESIVRLSPKVSELYQR